MSSMGYVMMNWSSELMMQIKKGKKLEMRKRRRDDDESELEVEDRARSRAAEEQRRSDEPALENYMSRVSALESELNLMQTQQDEIRKRIDASKCSLTASAQREKKLKSQNESLQLEEAQARFELKELKRTLDEELDRREKEHEEQIQLLEKVMSEKDAEWRRQHEVLQSEFGSAMRHTLEQKSIENMTRTQLEQELSSLANVMDMRSEELQQERKMNGELMQRVERLYYLESELGKARQRVEEMNLVVQNKMVAEKELIDISEALANDLGNSRQEVSSLRRQIENKQYLHSNGAGAGLMPMMQQQQQPCSMTSDYYSSTESGSPSQKRNHHQKALGNLIRHSCSALSRSRTR